MTTAAELAPDGTSPYEIPTDAPDPFIGPCPSWCVCATGDPHEVVAFDIDRVHYGDRHIVMVRSEVLEYVQGTPRSPSLFYRGSAEMNLEQHDAHRDAIIWLGKGETGTGFTLQLSEAEDIADTLLALVAAARQNAEQPR